MQAVFNLGAALLHRAVDLPAKSVGWSFEPGVLVPLCASGALFLAGAIRRRGRPGWSRNQAFCFSAGWMTLFVALVSPVHRLGAQLFSVHMTQHELLMIIAAPLLVLAQPLLWFLWALPQRWREILGAWIKRPAPAAIWAAMTLPLFVWL